MQAYLTIAGNIGVGKSTFTKLLAERLGAEAVFESVEENPYLADFYQDMGRWGFHSQVFFLSRRIRQHREHVNRASGVVIQDRSIYEDNGIFARNLHQAGDLSARDWATYDELYQVSCDALRPPDLIVYLKASVPVLLQRIKKRGREYEKALPEAYLARLNSLYDVWAGAFRRAPVLEIDTDTLDFVERPGDLEAMVARVKLTARL